MRGTLESVNRGAALDKTIKLPWLLAGWQTGSFDAFVLAQERVRNVG